jgi:hypothetical protein
VIANEVECDVPGQGEVRSEEVMLFKNSCPVVIVVNQQWWCCVATIVSLK